ncbi:glycosyltransferase [Marinicrinis sediminis]|uniref:Glycosyltransferase n=1 Tax=Marinicrinis sediminis TaxID=1652465 RepID=A0ABW5RCD3_9BACL
MHRVTVAYLDHTARWSGGEIALFHLLSHMKEGVQPLVILAEEGPLADRMRSRGIEVRIVPLSEKVRSRGRHQFGLSLLTSAIALLRYGRKVGSILKEEQVQLVHTNSLKSALYGVIAAKIARVPLVWHIRDQISSPYLKPPVAKTIRLLARICPKGIIANSVSTLETLKLPKQRKAKTAVVYSCFAGRMDQQTKVARTSRLFHVLLAGRLAEWKGQHVFIEAAALLKEQYAIHFWIAGDALFGEQAYKRQLEMKIRSHGLTNVSMLGHVEQMKELMESADLLVHTSITPEPFGQVIVEGMACGLPVVASNAGGPREIVVHGETGLLIEPNQPEILAEAISWMVQNPKPRQLMGERGRERVVQQFTMEQSVHKVNDLYHSLLWGSTAKAAE